MQPRKVLAIVQARMRSGRLPGKVLAPVLGVPMLARLVGRLRRARRVDTVVVATGEGEANRPIVEFGQSHGVPVHVGSEEDVLQRFVSALSYWPADAVVRITADCPLVVPEIVDDLVGEFLESVEQPDYLTNSPIVGRRIVEGTDVEVFSSSLLLRLDRTLTDPFWREWFNVYVQENTDRFKVVYRSPDEDFSRYRLTVDYPEDLNLVEEVFRHLESSESSDSLGGILRFLDSHPDLRPLNAKYRGSAVRRYREARAAHLASAA